MSTSPTKKITRAHTYAGSMTVHKEQIVTEEEGAGSKSLFYPNRKAVVEVTAQAGCRIRVPMRLDVDFRNLTIRPAGRFELTTNCQAVENY